MPKVKPGLSEHDFLLSLGESLRYQAHRPNINGYVPHPKQVDFHSSPAPTRLYAGGNRSGKSFSNVAECVYWLRKDHPYRYIPVPDYEPTRGRICTVDFPHGMHKILIPLFSQLMPPSLLINGSWQDSFHAATKTINCSNGSNLEILSYESELEAYAGTSRHFVGYDEEPPEDIYIENKARLIDTGGHQWYSLTPVEGMSWIYDEIFLKGERGVPGFHNTTSDMAENPHLNPEYVKEFLDGLSEEERRIRGKGIFVQIGGLIYKKFDPQPGSVHVIDKENMRFPKDVPIGMSLDHGFNNPAAVLWHAILPGGKIITFHQYYVSGEIISSVARYIHDFNRKNKITPSVKIADPSIRNVDPISGSSIQQEYAKHGINWEPGNNAVRDGIIKVASYLEPDPETKKPMWQCTKDCPDLIREMSRYRWKTYTSKMLDKRYNNFEEPLKKDDHCPDSLRYFLMSRPDMKAILSSKAQENIQERFENTGSVPSDGTFIVRDLRNEEEFFSRKGEYSSYDDTLGGLY